MAIRIFIVAFLFLFAFFQTCIAIEKLDKKTIQESQIYGANNCLLSLNEFLDPWTSFEEEAIIVIKNSECSYMYTPFLLVALDARNKVLSKEKITLKESEDILKIYEGYWVFNTIFFDYDQNLLNNSKIFIKQGKLIFKADQFSLISKEHYLDDEAMDTYKINCYLYFKSKKLSLKEPIYLIIECENSRNRSFYFNIKNIK